MFCCIRPNRVQSFTKVLWLSQYETTVIPKFEDFSTLRRYAVWSPPEFEDADFCIEISNARRCLLNLA